MVETGAGKKNIFRQIYQIPIEDIYHQANGYFGLTSIVNVVIPLPNHLVVSAILNLSII